MPFNDLREFIAGLEENKEAVRIQEEVDWNLEAGAILRRSAEQNLPAPFFQKIKGYPAGYRIFGGGGSNFRRLALALDMNPDTPVQNITEEYLRRKANPIKPVIVTYGPCQENIHLGEDVDLLEFPVPLLHQGDGGRYIGTWHLTISKDPESDWVNWGMYRHMLHNKNTVGMHASTSTKHLWAIFLKNHKPRNKAMEVAIAIGTDPVLSLCACSLMPYGVSEVDIAGGLRREPVRLVKCRTVDLLVPDTSEIVLEGEIRPDDLMEEGPFGEFTGYQASERAPRPVIRVKAVTHRDDPILAVSCVGTPVDDDCAYSLGKGAEILELLRKRGMPVTGAYVFPESSYLIAAVAVKAQYYGIAGDVAHAIWGVPSLGHTLPYVIVVDDDVDPYNISQVFHAIATKCHPFKGIMREENSNVIRLMPWLSKSEQRHGIGAKVYFDCTWPKSWDASEIPQRVSFRDSYSKEIRQKALDTWRKYGY